MAKRVALVTGANRGIGEEIANELEVHGLRVLRTMREVRDGYIPLDVTRPEAVAMLAERVGGEGGLDVLINNAGASLDGFDAEVAQKTLDVNFYGPMRVTDALLPVMKGGGRIVMVSSGMGSLSGVRGDLRRRIADPASLAPP